MCALTVPISSSPDASSLFSIMKQLLSDAQSCLLSEAWYPGLVNQHISSYGTVICSRIRTKPFHRKSIVRYLLKLLKWETSSLVATLEMRRMKPGIPVFPSGWSLSAWSRNRKHSSCAIEGYWAPKLLFEPQGLSMPKANTVWSLFSHLSLYQCPHLPTTTLFSF